MTRPKLPLARAPGATLVLALALTTLGCANFIRESDAVVPDVVPGTARAGFESIGLEGGVATGKVRFVCQKQLFAVTNIYETPYEGAAEAYEVPVGLLAIVPAFLWYGLSELVTLGAIEHATAIGPVHWATAGLNPLLNVENGMFRERYAIRRKPGSQRPQEGSVPEPYDAVVPPESPLRVAFEGGEAVEVPRRDQIGVTLNLLEVARAMPSPRSQKVLLTVTLRWNPEAPPVEKTIPIYLDAELAARLYAIREVSRRAREAATATEREEALTALASAGFSREAAMLRDSLPPLPTGSGP